MPQNYEGAFGKLIYTIEDANPDQPFDVSVLGEATADVLGIKRLRGQRSYEVNIAPYMRRAMDVVPQWQAQCGLYHPAGRAAAGRIKIGATVTEPHIFTAGIRNAPASGVLSDAPQVHTLAAGEIDELSVMGCPDEPLFFYAHLIKGDTAEEMLFSNASPPTWDMLAETVNYHDLARLAESKSALGSLDAYDALQIAMRRDGVMTVLRRYEFVRRPPRAVRLCWVNAYGAIDYYTFVATGERSVVGEKSRVYTDGYEVYGSAAQRLLTVRSGLEDAATTEWLAGAVTSPRVWICDGGEYRRMDVLTSEVALTDDRPTALTLSLREAQRIEYQKF